MHHDVVMSDLRYVLGKQNAGCVTSWLCLLLHNSIINNVASTLSINIDNECLCQKEIVHEYEP